MKKYWKKCRAGNREAKEEDEEGAQPARFFDGGPPHPPHPFGNGRRWGGGGGRHHRRGGGGGRQQPNERFHPFAHFGEFPPGGSPASIYNMGPVHTTPGGYSDDSSSSSTSSESEVETRNGNHKKSKKFMKRLAKKHQKVTRRMEKLKKKQRKLDRRLGKLKHKEAKLARLLFEENQKMRSDGGMQNNQGPGPNQPGHDPNPNSRPRCNPWAAFAYNGPPPYRPMGARDRMWQPYAPPAQPNAPPPPPAASGPNEFENKLALLIEMGFTDVPLLKRLLKDTKGDLKAVVTMLSLKDHQNLKVE